MKFVLAIYLFLIPVLNWSQSTDIAEIENKLSLLLDDLRSAENNQDKEAKNRLFKAELETALQSPEAFEYSFSKLKTVGFIDSPDKEIRIVNWNVEQDDMSQKYYCFVIHQDKRKKEQVVTELKDISFGMPSHPSDILSSDEWYGALYYKIIPVNKGSKTLYTVLGWDHNSSLSQVKLIDVIYFSGSSVKLGSPIFKIGKETKKRVFYEHSKKATMHLNYESDRKRIMMDHLSPESPSMANFRSFYVPDLSYDAFIFKGGKWILEEDVIGVNPESDIKKQDIYVKNEKTGRVEKRSMKTKWENPEDANAPGGGSEHVAVTPETAKTEDKNKSSDEPKVNKKDKRDPTQVSFMHDVKKNKRRKKKTK